MKKGLPDGSLCKTDRNFTAWAIKGPAPHVKAEKRKLQQEVKDDEQAWKGLMQDKRRKYLNLSYSGRQKTTHATQVDTVESSGMQHVGNEGIFYTVDCYFDKLPEGPDHGRTREEAEPYHGELGFVSKWTFGMASNHFRKERG